MRLLLCLAALSLLPACMRGDVLLDFVDADTVVARSAYAVPQALVTELGKGPEGVCGRAQPESGARNLYCRGQATNTMAQLKRGVVDFGSLGGPLDLSEVMSTETLSRGRARVSIDLDALIVAIRSADLHKLAGTRPQNASFLSGEGLTIRIRARDIVGTTGRLSHDGHEAHVHLPAERFLEQEPQSGGPFITVLRFEDECFFELFCD